MEDTTQKSPPGEPIIPKKSGPSIPSRRHIPRRRQMSSVSFMRTMDIAGIPIPATEAGNLGGEESIMRSRGQLNSSELLAPKPSSLRFTTPPPKDRILTSWDEDKVDKSDSIPASSAMNLDINSSANVESEDEDSMNYGIGSYGSSSFSERFYYSSASASNDDSCTSPESETSSSGFTSSIKGSLKGSLSSSQPIYSVSSTMSSKRVKIADEKVWSSEMDVHLWTTFGKYTDDATVTPYDSACPPQGVYRRVSKQAIVTWNNGIQYGEKYRSIREKPSDMIWPHSESATCVRLKALIKEKEVSAEDSASHNTFANRPYPNLDEFDENLSPTRRSMRRPPMTRPSITRPSMTLPLLPRPTMPPSPMTPSQMPLWAHSLPQMRTGHNLVRQTIDASVKQLRQNVLAEIRALERRHFHERLEAQRPFGYPFHRQHTRISPFLPQRLEEAQPLDLTPRFKEMSMVPALRDFYTKDPARRSPLSDGAWDPFVSPPSVLGPINVASNPVLPQGWASSGQFQGHRPSTPVRPSTSGAASSSRPVHTQYSQLFRSQNRPGNFQYYFRDFNDREARRQPGIFGEDTEMVEDEGNTSEHSSEE